jgi:hypothetical protein
MSQATRATGLQRKALLYFQSHPDKPVMIEEVAQATGVTPKQASNAVSALVEKHAEHLERRGRGIYRWSSKARQQMNGEVIMFQVIRNDGEKMLVVLARFAYLFEQSGPRTHYEVVGLKDGGPFDLDGREFEAYLSLERMAYIVQSDPRTVRHAAAEDTLSEAGKDRLQTLRARHYVCCPHAIRLPCVCSERTYCPNPEHRGGCHGTHD